MKERTWKISDIDGRNPRTVTLAQYRAELDARMAFTRKISDALRAGDLKAMEAAQIEMRKVFAS